MSEQYQAFEIHVLKKAGDVYPLVARASGDATFQGAIHIDLLAALDVDDWFEQSLNDVAYPRELGSRLFDALFSGEVLLGFRTSLAVAKAQGMGLRLVLTLEPPELARLPWELIYAERFEGFLARSAATPLVRHLSSPNPARPPVRGQALRVLVAVAEPEELPALGATRQEANAIAAALGGGPIQVDTEPLPARSRVANILQRARAALRSLVIGQERVRVRVIEHATRNKLQDALREAERADQGYHIVHFVGHGASDESGGHLILEDGDGFPDPVPAEQVAELLDGTAVNMVFLNACASAREGKPGRPFYPFRGVAQACVNLGIRAALAMQVEIVDRAAAAFAREFYTSLADEEEVEKAVLDARQVVGKGDAADWAVPVLYSRVPEGSILAPELTRPPKSLWDRLQGLGRRIREHPVVALLLGLFSILALVLSLSLDIQAARQPGGLLYPIWPAPTATPTPLPPMSEGFNVAVAEFASLDAAGQLAVTEESRELSDWLYRAIKAERDRLPATQTFEIRGPDQVRAVWGTDPDARAANAKGIAAQHNATLLIYGLVIAGDNGYRVQPEFHIQDSAFGYGSEVAGADRLGIAVPFEPPLGQPGTLVGINETLDARAQALRHLVAGLDFYYLERYDEAWAAFRQAELLPGWQAEEGKEVVYLLMAAARLRQYNTQEADVRYLSEALDALAEARQLNPDYARSYLGLGQVALLQAVHDEEAGVDGEKLVEARGWYSASLAAPDQPESAHVPVKAHFGLGQVYLKGYEHGLPGWSAEEARRHLEQVVAAYEQERDPDLVWLAGNATALLGLLAGAERDWTGMSADCREAIDLLSSLPAGSQQATIAQYWTWVARAEEEAKNLEAARDALWQAIQAGKDVVPREELETWQNKLDGLEKGTP